jgi:Dolichyl-phosphate-mannose-protein mannosyltransferase
MPRNPRRLDSERARAAARIGLVPAAASTRSAWPAVAAAVGLAAWLIAPRTRLPIGFDGLHVYLPMARSVLQEGWAYLQRPDCLVTAPIAYLYPALLGANEALVRWANVVLYCASLVVAFFALRTAHSRAAGIAAAFLLALSPTLRPFVADVLTEPPFFLFIAAYIACVALVASGRSSAWAVAGGAALAAAALTRPAVMYFAPLMLVVFAATRIAPAHRGKLVLLHAVALGLTALWIVRNAIAFGFPAIATGAGAALYFGVNPLVDGFEPAYYGLNYDSGVAQDSASHLSLHSDRRLRDIALVELRDTPLGVIAEMFLRKTLAFVFVSSAEPAGGALALLRSWRIALVVLAAVALAMRRKNGVVATLAILVAYMLAVHMPVFYNHRYSVGAIEIPLTLLAAVGLVETAGSARIAAVTLTAMAFALGLGLLDAARAGPKAPRPERIPHEVMWLRDVGSSFPVGPGEPPIDIAIGKDPRAPLWDLSMLQIDLAIAGAAKGAGCTAMTVRFKPAGEERFAEGRSARIFLPAEPARERRLTIGSTVPLALDRDGTVRLEFECASPATAEIGTMAVIAPRREVYYRDRFLELQRPP